MVLHLILAACCFGLWPTVIKPLSINFLYRHLLFNPELYCSFLFMEPEVKAFLLLIIQTLSMALLWMLVNMTAGIYFNLAFFEKSPSLFNIIYYVFFLSTLFLLIKYFIKRWKGFREID
jgi:hypothetical protein